MERLFIIFVGFHVHHKLYYFLQIKRDPVTQQSKGYGFIRFADYTAQVMCLAERHTIENRQCDVRIPISKVTIFSSLKAFFEL